MDDPTHKLFRAVAEYVESIGGNVLVAGPVTIEDRRGPLRFAYHLCVAFAGAVPDEVREAFQQQVRGEQQVGTRVEVTVIGCEGGNGGCTLTR